MGRDFLSMAYKKLVKESIRLVDVILVHSSIIKQSPWYLVKYSTINTHCYKKIDGKIL